MEEEIARPPVDLIVDGDLRVKVYVWDLSAGYNFNLFEMPLKISANVYNLLNYNYVEFLGNIQPMRNYSLRLDMFF
jgi:outer membrane receptor protein involved in Fe transport